MPLDNNCLKNVIYKATITSAKEIKYYIDSTGNTFKSRWYSHNNSFNNYKDNGTELAKYIWHLKHNKIIYDIKWIILHHIGEIKSIYSICKTCILEKLKQPMLTKKSTYIRGTSCLQSVHILRNSALKLNQHPLISKLNYL